MQKVFPSYLAKFQSITNITTRIFWTFIFENLAPPLIAKRAGDVLTQTNKMEWWMILQIS